MVKKKLSWYIIYLFFQLYIGMIQTSALIQNGTEDITWPEQPAVCMAVGPIFTNPISYLD